LKYPVSFGLKMGSLWSFYSWDHFGIGLKMGWFDFSFARKGDDFLSPSWQRFTFDFSLLEMGPLFIFAINKKIAFDVYYTARPQFLISTTFDYDYYYDYTYYDDYSSPYLEALGLGIGHNTGFTFRYYVLSIGIEYIFGSIPDLDYVDQYGFSDGPKIGNSCVRLIVGVAL
jgi:hypothetical protein